jgi:hypothetical protein
MTGGFLFLTIGMLFIVVIFCLVFALNQLAGPSRPTNVHPIPIKPESDDAAGAKLRKLGRPIEAVKIA